MMYVATYHEWVRKHFSNTKGVLQSQFLSWMSTSLNHSFYHGWVRKHFPNTKGRCPWITVLPRSSIHSFYSSSSGEEIWLVKSVLQATWLIVRGVLWHSSNGNLTRNAPILNISLVTTKPSHSQVSRTFHITWYYSGSKVTMYIDICCYTQQAIQKHPYMFLPVEHLMNWHLIEWSIVFHLDT